MESPGTGSRTKSTLSKLPGMGQGLKVGILQFPSSLLIAEVKEGNQQSLGFSRDKRRCLEESPLSLGLQAGLVT